MQRRPPHAQDSREKPLGIGPRGVDARRRQGLAGGREGLAPRPRWRTGGRSGATSARNALELLGLLGRGQGLDDLVEVTLQHIGQPVEGQADPVVGDPGLGEVVGPDPLAPLAGADLAPAVGGDGRRLLLLRPLEQARAQHPERLRPVLQLRPLVLAGDDEARGQVRDPDRRVGGVDPLPPGPEAR